MQKKSYQPGETILEQGQPVEKFYMLADGVVDILIQHPRCPEINLARLGPGDYFGDIELTQGDTSVAQVRVAQDGAAEIYQVDKVAFTRILQDSTITKKLLEKTATKRLAENQAQGTKDC